jgi:hypothetical protein
VADADAAHVIADLLMRLKEQGPSPLDPASLNATISWPKSRL